MIRKGLLRQSNQESRKKRIEKKWEDDDFYASDEDEFLDGDARPHRAKRSHLAEQFDDDDAEGDTMDTERLGLNDFLDCGCFGSCGCT